jgi:ABC-type enterochelin transport system substrate-binding protein
LSLKYLTIKILRKMKKIIALFAIVSVFAFTACNNAAETEEAATETVEGAEAEAESLLDAAGDAVEAAADTVEAAAEAAGDAVRCC